LYSKNKAKMTAAEKDHVGRLKEMPCAVCNESGPSECHEIRQGLWFTSIPLCSDCHRGSINGWHGQKRMWNVKKMDELDALDDTIRQILSH